MRLGADIGTVTWPSGAGNAAGPWLVLDIVLPSRFDQLTSCSLPLKSLDVLFHKQPLEFPRTALDLDCQDMALPLVVTDRIRRQSKHGGNSLGGEQIHRFVLLER